ncbi:MAG TPA: signal recognition particle protein [Dehalococcoidia bacterium]|nr:signal recognition particle protein [Dehalococcoidia bacterium]
MLEALSDKLSGVFQKLGSHGTISEKDLYEAMREVRIALLEADVNFKVVRQFIATVRERALGAEVLKSLTGPQQVIGIVNEELVNILGGSPATLQLASKPPTVVMLVGLKGSGKTTTAAKLALHLRKQGARPLLVAADPHRMAAGEQLKALARQLGMPVFEGAEGQALPALCSASLAEAKRQGATVVIVDTAGRSTIDGELMDEVAQMRVALEPHETILVLDAMTGQEAVNVAQEFHAQLQVTGIIVSKMDGDARGGAVLSIRAVTGLPVKFIGTGEKSDALEPFYPDRFASRILGMGDMLGLIERAKEAISEQDVHAIEKKMKAKSLDLEDFLVQFQRIKKMGPLNQLVDMIPGLGQVKRQMNVASFDDGFWNKAEAVVYSMTPQERKHPEIINGSRRRRIAKGSGTTPQEVNQLLNQWKEAKKIMQGFAGNRSGFLNMFGGR